MLLEWDMVIVLVSSLGYILLCRVIEFRNVETNRRRCVPKSNKEGGNLFSLSSHQQTKPKTGRLQMQGPLPMMLGCLGAPDCQVFGNCGEVTQASSKAVSASVAPGS